MDFLAREIAVVADPDQRHVATRDFLRSELRDLVDELGATRSPTRSRRRTDELASAGRPRRRHRVRGV
jgi:hypothetical protein